MEGGRARGGKALGVRKKKWGVSSEKEGVGGCVALIASMAVHVHVKLLHRMFMP